MDYSKHQHKKLKKRLRKKQPREDNNTNTPPLDQTLLTQLTNTTGDYIQSLNTIYDKLEENKNNQQTVIPPVQIKRTGPRKTTWTNTVQISQHINRPIKHLQKYFAAVFNVEINLTKDQKMIFCNVYDAATVQNDLANYIKSYVMCGECNSMKTIISPDKNQRVNIKQCLNCNAESTVSDIKKAISIETRKERRAKKMAK